MPQANTPVAGSSCTVTSGTHKGKTGTYSRDDDGVLWCDVDGGSTDCTNGACKDGKAKLQVRDFAGADGLDSFEVNGLVEVPGKGIFDVSAIIDARSGKATKMSAVSLSPVPLESLQTASTEAERHAAAALMRHFEERSKADAFVAAD